MNGKKLWRLLGVILALGVLTQCSLFHTESRPSDVNKWKIGLSAGGLQRLNEETFTKVREAGFDCVEIGLSMQQPATGSLEQQCKSVKEWSAKSGVKIWSVHIPYGPAYDISTVDPAGRGKAIENITQILDLCKILKPQKGILHPSFEPIKPEERAARLKACKEALPIVTRQAAARGVQIAIECLPRTCLGNTSAEILELLRGVDGLGVCCDVNHLLQETQEDFIRKAGAHIKTLHINDYDGKDERHWMPGEGIIKWDTVLGSLVNVGYEGPFLFECRGTPEEKMARWEKMKKNYLGRRAP